MYATSPTLVYSGKVELAGVRRSLCTVTGRERKTIKSDHKLRSRSYAVERSQICTWAATKSTLAFIKETQIFNKVQTVA
jgi:hypothetical protein